MNSMHYDVIIIGAGLSGLAAGIRLSHYQKRVLILERHGLPGGLNSWFRRGGRQFDVGLHAVTNFAGPENRQAPLNKLLRQLRFRREDLDLCEQGFSTVEFPGRTLRFSNEFADFEASIAAAFPMQIDGFRRLVDRIKATESLSLQAVPVSARAVLAGYLTDPILVDMILEPLMYYGSAEADDIEFNQFCIMFQSLFLEGFWRPAAGVRPLLEMLVARYKENGGELRMRCGVKSLRTDGDLVTAVELDNGEVLTASSVLSSAGAAETFRLCEPAPEQAASQPLGALSYVESIFVLDCSPASLGVLPTITFFNNHDHFDYRSPAGLVDYRSGVLCAPNNFKIPAEKQPEPCLRLTHLANYAAWDVLPAEAYAAAKQEVLKRQLAFLETRAPGVSGHVVATDLFTPLTVTRFTGHLNGAIYGSPAKLRDGRTHCRNLFVCGTDQGFLGIIGSMLSGISITNAWLLRGE